MIEGSHLGKSNQFKFYLKVALVCLLISKAPHNNTFNESSMTMSMDQYRTIIRAITWTYYCALMCLICLLPRDMHSVNSDGGCGSVINCEVVQLLSD